MKYYEDTNKQLFKSFSLGSSKVIKIIYNSVSVQLHITKSSGVKHSKLAKYPFLTLNEFFEETFGNTKNLIIKLEHSYLRS